MLSQVYVRQLHTSNCQSLVSKLALWNSVEESSQSLHQVHSHVSPREGESSTSAALSVSKVEFSELMTTIKGTQQNMESMKRELSAERDAESRWLIAEEDAHHQGHRVQAQGKEKQHIFNEEVKDKIETVTKALSAIPPAVEKAKEAPI